MVEILRSTHPAGDVKGIDIKNYFCFVDLTPLVSGQTGTLDRKLRSSGSGVGYPLYHTCNRQQNKKKVTIVDSGGRDDESKV